MTIDEAETARQVCLSNGFVCPDPGNHVLLPDGTIGPHAWVIQAIKDARNSNDG